MHNGGPLRRTFTVIVITFLLFCSSTTLFVSSAAGAIKWGDVKEITDKEDFFLDDYGNPIGYLDRHVSMEAHNGKLYVAWESSERTGKGSMILVRTLKGHEWGDIRTVAGKEDDRIDTDPVLASYDGGLYLVWQEASGQDTELWCKVLELGEWSSCGEVSQEDDFGLDYEPSLAVFDGRLWAAWVTKSPVTGKDTGGGDVVVRSFDGYEWSEEITVLSRTPAKGYETTPRLLAYGDRLVAAWATRDPGITNGTDLDIVMRVYDGKGWAEHMEVTGLDGEDDDDAEPVMAEYKGLLYIIWQSDGDMEFETDIHVVSYDGTKVSSEKDLLPANNMAADEHPVAAVFKDRLYVAWNSNDVEITDGGDDDIAISYFDGTRWSTPEEVTPKDMEEEEHDGGDHHHTYAAQDRFPQMEVYDGGLYVSWEQDDQRTTLMDPGDIKYRRSPPEGSKLDIWTVLFLLFLTLLIFIGLVLWMMGPSTDARQERYLKRREDESIHRKALSRAGRRAKRTKDRKRKKKN